jgi:DNA-binding NarL/FixJ family response regulator
MDPAQPITVAVARFEDLLARGLTSVLQSDRHLRVVATDVEPDRLGVVLRAHRPRVAVLDVDALRNLAQVRSLRRRHPHTALVLVAAAPAAAESAQLLAFGASACLSRATQARDVLNAIHLAARGLQLVVRVGERSGAPLTWSSPLLTRRESDVLPLLQQGRSNAQIALALHIGVETVRSHARNIFRKLGVASRRELAVLPSRALDEQADGPIAVAEPHHIPPVGPRVWRAGPIRRR